MPAKDPRAAFGWIIMEPFRTPPMSGSNSICMATVLLDCGLVPMAESETHFMLEAPVGLVAVTAFCANGKARAIRVTNLPSFVQALDAMLEVPGHGSVRADTANGGDSFVLVDAASLGFALRPDEVRNLSEMGIKLTRAATEQLGFARPTNPDWSHISFCQFTAPVTLKNGIRTGCNTVAIEPGKLDHSPTGTGCPARMAVMHARGEMVVGDAFTGLSILGSRFDCRTENTISLNGAPAIVPTIQGRAWITGTRQLMLAPNDPKPQAYHLGDTWPMM